MSGPDIDFESPNAMGRLDQLVVNFAVSTIAVVPTFFTCLSKPWRMQDLIKNEHPKGRKDLLLAPGAFFPLALMVSFISAAMLSTPETVQYNGAYIGPELALRVQSAAANGEIWKIVATVMPIYGFAVFYGLLGAALSPFVPNNWTLQKSLRASLYVIGILVCWAVITTAAIDLIAVTWGSGEIATTFYSIFLLPTLTAILWMYFGVFYKKDECSKFRAALLSVAMFGLLVLAVMMIGILASLEQ